MILPLIGLFTIVALQSIPLAPNSIDIQLNISSSKLEVNKELSLFVNITNLADYDIKDLRVSLTSPGLTITQSPNFPETLFAHSEIRGFYVLKANVPGDTKAWLSATYTVNGSNQSLGQHQFSYISKPFFISIVDDPNLQLTQIWTGSITTILGAILGAILGTLSPVLYNRLNRTRENKSKRISSINKAKSLLEYELDYNRKLLDEFQKCSVSKWDEVIRDYYHLISETPKLSDALLHLYSRLNDYNEIKDPILRKSTIDKKSYLEQIDQTLTLVKNWNIDIK